MVKDTVASSRISIVFRSIYLDNYGLNFLKGFSPSKTIGFKVGLFEPFLMDVSYFPRNGQIMTTSFAVVYNPSPRLVNSRTYLVKKCPSNVIK